MSKSFFALIITAGLLAGANDASAQRDRDPVSGLRERAELVDQQVMALDGKEYTATITPGLLKTKDGVTYTGSLTFAAGRLIPSLPLQVRTTYRNVQPDEGGAAERLDIQGKVVAPNTEIFRRTFSTAFVVDYKRTLSSRTRTEYKLANSLGIISGFTLDNELAYLRSTPDELATTEDFRITPGISFEVGRAELGAGYSTRNDVDGEDDWSASIAVPFESKQTRIKPLFEIGKHGAVLVSVSASL